MTRSVNCKLIHKHNFSNISPAITHPQCVLERHVQLTLTQSRRMNTTWTLWSPNSNRWLFH